MLLLILKDLHTKFSLLDSRKTTSAVYGTSSVKNFVFLPVFGTITLLLHLTLCQQTTDSSEQTPLEANDNMTC